MEQADQIDTLAYAAMEVSREAAGTEMVMPKDAMPTSELSCTGSYF
jgi:hypothetical protein